MAKIFLSYRRNDAADAAGRLYDHLHERFGPQAIFMDVDSIPIGINFRSHLQQAVIRSNVLLVLISERWLNVSYKDGPRQGERRIDDPDDFVRIEIEAALSSGIPVIPLLTGQAQMPTPDELPMGMKELAYQQGAELRAGRDYHGHIERLIRDLTRMIGSAPQQGTSEPTHSAATPSGLVAPPVTQVLDSTIPVISARPAPEVATRISNALRDIDADKHGDMGSFYVRDNNSRRIFGRLKTELAAASLEEILQALLPYLESSYPMERWKAMRLLVWWKLATPDIIRRFWEKEPEWICRQIVIEAAQGLAEADRLDLLADVALLDDNGRNRRDALPHLTGLAQGPQRGRIINVLMALLEMEDRWGAIGARPEALRQLRALKVSEVVEKARELLRDDKNDSVRNEAAALISELGRADTLLDIGEALSREHINEYVFKECLSRYLQRFNPSAVSAVISAMGAARVRQVAEDWVREKTNPSAMSRYFASLSGKVIYTNGSEQTFSGFRCFYSGRLYYSRNVESLASSNYKSAPTIDLRQVTRIDFGERPNESLRRGNAQLRDGKTLQNLFFYVGECSWWEKPGLEGKMDDPFICALVITEPRQEEEP